MVISFLQTESNYTIKVAFHNLSNAKGEGGGGLNLVFGCFGLWVKRGEKGVKMGKIELRIIRTAPSMFSLPRG